jgi:GntR family transcriptional regulator, arabinose operon transcriptional repressor
MSNSNITPQTKYSKVRDHIQSLIAHGTIQKGDSIPGELELAEQLAVSRNTVRHALLDMANDGVIERTRGRGTVYLGEEREKINTKMVGMVAGMLKYSIYLDLINGIEDGLHREGYSMLLANGNNNHEKEQLSISRMMEQGIEGLIIEPHMNGLLGPKDPFFKTLNTLDIPLLTINCAIEGLKASSVTVDDFGIGKKAAEHLITRGHRKMACVYMSDSQAGILRFRGFKETLSRHGIEPKEEYFRSFSSRDTIETSGRVLGRKLMETDPPPTAIFFFNDGTALQALEEFKTLEISVPGDVSIIGVDNISESVLVSPTLTTFNHPKYLMGTIAADMVLARLGNKSHNSTDTVTILPELISRGSVGNNGESPKAVPYKGA